MFWIILGIVVFLVGFALMRRELWEMTYVYPAPSFLGVFALFLMIVGFVSFLYGSGAFSSIDFSNFFKPVN